MKKRNLWGLLLIFSAFYLIADLMGWNANLPSLFTMVLTLIFVSISVSSIPKLDFYGMIMPLSFIGILYSKELTIADNNRWTIVFAAFLLSSGLNVIFKHHRLKRKYSSSTFEYRYDIPTDDYQASDSAEDHIRVDVSFSSRTRYVRSNNFTYADLRCDFGSLEVYFNDAQFNPRGSIINIDCNFGSIKMYLPKGIRVENNVEVSLASNDDQHHYQDPNAPLVQIRGDVSLGSLEIVYI